MSDERHVMPIGDLVAHVASEDCVCGPAVEPVECADGSFGWLYIHHTLDGRDLTELRAWVEGRRSHD